MKHLNFFIYVTTLIAVNCIAFSESSQTLRRTQHLPLKRTTQVVTLQPASAVRNYLDVEKGSYLDPPGWNGNRANQRRLTLRTFSSLKSRVAPTFHLISDFGPGESDVFYLKVGTYQGSNRRATYYLMPIVQCWPDGDAETIDEDDEDDEIAGSGVPINENGEEDDDDDDDAPKFKPGSVITNAEPKRGNRETFLAKYRLVNNTDGTVSFWSLAADSYLTFSIAPDVEPVGGFQLCPTTIGEHERFFMHVQRPQSSGRRPAGGSSNFRQSSNRLQVPLLDSSGSLGRSSVGIGHQDINNAKVAGEMPFDRHRADFASFDARFVKVSIESFAHPGHYLSLNCDGVDENSTSCGGNLGASSGGHIEPFYMVPASPDSTTFFLASSRHLRMYVNVACQGDIWESVTSKAVKCCHKSGTELEKVLNADGSVSLKATYSATFITLNILPNGESKSICQTAKDASQKFKLHVLSMPKADSRTRALEVKSLLPVCSNASDEWRMMVQCDNTEGSDMKTCLYEKFVGIDLNGQVLVKRVNYSQTIDELKREFSQLPTNVDEWRMSLVDNSFQVIQSLQSGSSNRLMGQVQSALAYPGQSVSFAQLVGYCGNFTVYTKQVRKTSLAANGDAALAHAHSVRFNAKQIAVNATGYCKIPTEEWLEVAVCDNTEGSEPMGCSHERIYGVQDGNRTLLEKQNQAVFANLRTIYRQMYTKNAGSFHQLLSSRQVWNPNLALNVGQHHSEHLPKHYDHGLTVPPGANVTIVQLISHCGQYLLLANKYKFELQKHKNPVLPSPHDQDHVKNDVNVTCDRMTDAWVFVKQCDNTASEKMTVCEFNATIGIRSKLSASSSASEAVLAILKSRISHIVSPNRHRWLKTLRDYSLRFIGPSSADESQHTRRHDLNAPANSKVTVLQLVGYCGDFTILTRQYQYDFNGGLEEMPKTPSAAMTRALRLDSDGASQDITPTSRSEDFTIFAPHFASWQHEPRSTRHKVCGKLQEAPVAILPVPSSRYIVAVCSNGLTTAFSADLGSDLWEVRINLPPYCERFSHAAYDDETEMMFLTCDHDPKLPSLGIFFTNFIASHTDSYLAEVDVELFAMPPEDRLFTSLHVMKGLLEKSKLLYACDTWNSQDCIGFSISTGDLFVDSTLSFGIPEDYPGPSTVHPNSLATWYDDQSGDTLLAVCDFGRRIVVYRSYFENSTASVQFLYSIDLEEQPERIVFDDFGYLMVTDGVYGRRLQIFSHKRFNESTHLAEPVWSSFELEASAKTLAFMLDRTARPWLARAYVGTGNGRIVSFGISKAAEKDRRRKR